MRTRVLHPVLSAAFGLSLLGCAAPSVDLPAWRARESVARPREQRGDLGSDLQAVERLRSADELAEARRLALALAAEHPGDVRVRLAASRAESDGAVLFPESDKDARNHALASALEHAERASALGDGSTAALAQLAWSLGGTTHLQSMGERSAHAHRTLEVAERALAQDPEDPTALATLAVLNLRLETLPWIANLMASGLPESSLAAAEDFARRAVAARPSRENRLILAKVLVAEERAEEARQVLEAALAEAPRHPRDHALEAPVRALLEELAGS
jgi:hypothetical protein